MAFNPVALISEESFTDAGSTGGANVEYPLAPANAGEYRLSKDVEERRFSAALSVPQKPALAPLDVSDISNHFLRIRVSIASVEDLARQRKRGRAALQRRVTLTRNDGL